MALRADLDNTKGAGGFRRPAPLLGEHTDAILDEAGLDRDAIASMREQGAAQ